MLTNKESKSRKLTYEILGIVAICFTISLIVFIFLTSLTTSLIENYLFNNDIILTEDEFFELDKTITITGLIISIIIFAILFIILFSKKISYIKELTNGIEKLRENDYEHEVSIQGNNELTDLAKEINFLSKQEKELKEKERKLKEEKEELIRNLSHDIRTPLTSIISYTELASKQDDKNQEYYSLVLKKANQIKELTDILLDGGKREVIYVEDGKLLIHQLVEEFEEILEDNYKLSINIDLIDNYSINIDINEIRRIFDNLITNIQKYADNNKDVELIITSNDKELVITQRNFIKEVKEETEHHNIGLNSIKKIVQNYDGNVLVNNDNKTFEIIIKLLNL